MTKKKKPEVEQLNKTVYPSDVRSIAVATDDEYGGAYKYMFIESLGHENGIPKYAGSEQSIQFIKKDLDGTVTPGLQDQQVLLALIDRHKKLNGKFPSREGALAITKMEEALHWLQARVTERIERGVMGDLKK